MTLLDDDDKYERTVVTKFHADRHHHAWGKVLFWACVLFAFIAVIVYFGGCAGGLNRTLQTLNSIEQAQVATVDAFDKFDHDYSLALIEMHKTEGKEATQAAWAKYDAVRTRMKQLILSSKVVASTAKALIPLIQDGQRSEKDIDALLVKLAAIGADMFSLVQSLGVPVGGAQ